MPLLISCPDAGSSTTYTVTFNSGEGSDVPSQDVKSGEKAVRPANPVQAEHSFANWYSDGAFQALYDFNQPVTGDITLYAEWHHELKSIVDSGTVPADLSTYGSLVQAVLEPYAADAAITAKYVDTTAQGSGDASSWANAAGDVKATLDGIADAGANTIYLVLLVSGTHTPADTLGMKSHLAIVGGWNEWEQSGTSTISGEDTRRVFYNADIGRTALLYGVTIADGNSGGSGIGGGMYNENSLPTLNNVIFAGNDARHGGGMVDFFNSSSTLINVTFFGNTADKWGGGMYNTMDSFPILINVTFAGNKAADGGGMFNSESSPTLHNVTFVDNEADQGGGMYNSYNTSPTLSNVTFVNNKADSNGGGMFNNNSSGNSPTIVNTLFWNNTGGASSETVGQQIYMDNDDLGGAENMTISFSLVQHGIGVTTGAASDNDATDGLGIGGGSAPVTVTQAHSISGGSDPMLAAALADNGGLVQTMALLASSPAANTGAYVQRSGTPGSFTFYYSEDDTNWFTDAALNTAMTGTIPADAIYLTAADARGYTRNDRPDIGAYEYGGTAP